MQGSVPEVLERDAHDVGVVADDHVALDVFEVEGNVRKLGDVLDEDVALHRSTDRDMDHQIHARVARTHTHTHAHTYTHTRARTHTQLAFAPPTP